MMVAARAGEVRVGMRMVVMIAAVVRVRTVRVLVAGVARRRGRCGIDRRGLVRGVAAGRRAVGAPRAGERDEAEGADHGFFLGGAEAIFCLSAASSSSRVEAGFLALVRGPGRGSDGAVVARRLSASS